MEALKVYVAGSSSKDRLLRAEVWVKQLEAMGCETYDWPAHIRKHGSNDEVVDKDVLRTAGEEEIAAVCAADLVIVLTWPGSPVISGGALIELGAALGASVPVWIVGPTMPHPLFGLMADVRFTSDDDALDAVAKKVGVA